MNVSAASSPAQQFRVPVTPQARLDDERTESVATKVKEARTGRDAPARVQSAGRVDISV